MGETLLNGMSLHVKFIRLPAFNIIIGEIAIIKIIESACGITSINQSTNWKNARSYYNNSRLCKCKSIIISTLGK